MPREDPTPLVTTRADKMNPGEIRAEIARTGRRAVRLRTSSGGTNGDGLRGVGLLWI